MKNYVDSGETFAGTAPRALTSGEGCLIGAIFGFAANAAASGAEVVLYREGRFTHAKTSAQAWTVGARLYWDDTNHVLTTSAAGNLPVGVAAAAAANPSATGSVILTDASEIAPQTAAALTYAAPSAYTAPTPGGAVAVLSAAATDLDTAAAALASVRTQLVALAADVAALRTELIAAKVLA